MNCARTKRALWKEISRTPFQCSIQQLFYFSRHFSATMFLLAFSINRSDFTRKIHTRIIFHWKMLSDFSLTMMSVVRLVCLSKNVSLSTGSWIFFEFFYYAQFSLPLSLFLSTKLFNFRRKHEMHRISNS